VTGGETALGLDAHSLVTQTATAALSVLAGCPCGQTRHALLDVLIRAPIEVLIVAFISDHPRVLVEELVLYHRLITTQPTEAQQGYCKQSERSVHPAYVS